MNDSIKDVDLLNADADVKTVISIIGEVAADLSNIISLGDIYESSDLELSSNSDGDEQKSLDLIADSAYISALKNSPVLAYVSEEQKDLIILNEDGSLLLAIAPLDGSSNIETNLSIGSIFSIRKYEVASKRAGIEKQFLRPGNEQIAAGYVIFGPQTILVVTTGNGVFQFVLNRKTQKFLPTKEEIQIPVDTQEYAVNASNARHWSKAMRLYIEDSNAGEVGPRDVNFNMRWVASLVAETHRILSRGGIFIYPSDSRKTYEAGRLRMVYECAPIALLIEQAGGGATNCIDRILDQPANSLHARTPFAFGSINETARLQAYHDLPKEETSPLFGRRGLFSS